MSGPGIVLVHLISYTRNTRKRVLSLISIIKIFNAAYLRQEMHLIGCLISITFQINRIIKICIINSETIIIIDDVVWSAIVRLIEFLMGKFKCALDFTVFLHCSEETATAHNGEYAICSLHTCSEIHFAFKCSMWNGLWDDLLVLWARCPVMMHDMMSLKNFTLQTE